MSYKCNVPIVDPYGFAIRTYEVEAIHHEAIGGEPEHAEALRVRVYDKAEPLVSEEPGEVDILDDLSDDTVKYLESKALEAAPERRARRTMPDKDDEGRAHPVFEGALSVMRGSRAADIAAGRDD